MKKIFSVLLILVLVISAFALTSISAFAEEAPAGDAAQSEGDFVTDFLGSILPLDALNGLKDSLFGIVEEMWNYIMSDSTYASIATAILACLIALAIPIVLGVLIVIYAAIAAMMIFAGALISVVEALFPIIPTLWK
jgi:hypothetical protein